MSSGLSPKLELARLRRVLKLESAGTWEWDLRTNAMTWDRGHRLLFGVADEVRITPELFLWLLHPDDRPHVEAVFDEALRARHEFQMEYRIRRPADGQQRWIEARGHVAYDGDAPVRAAGIVLDATERREAQRRLDAERDERMYHAEQVALLFDRNPAPMFLIDRRTLRVLEVNQAAIAEYGWTRDEFLARTILDLRPEEDVADFRQQLDQHFRQSRAEADARHRTADGSIRLVHVVAHDVEWEGHDARLVLAQDVTHQRALEAQLHEARKMEAVGQLAGGIAHDFNNLLTVLIASLEFARDHVTVPRALEHDLDEIESAATRARALVSQLLTFSKRQQLQLHVLSINDVIRQCEPTIRRLLGDHIRLVVALDDHDPQIQGDEGPLEQVLLNLTFNALEAIRAVPGAAPTDTHALRLRTTRVDHLPTEAARWPGLAVGACVELSLEDTGVGMTPEVQARAFEPFFTTKPPGSAQGLGLSAVLGVVQQLGGAIVVESQRGQGTVVRLRFPACTDMAPRTLSGSHAAITEANGTVLLAEDEPSVRAAVRRMLQALGYHVIEAPDGAVALSTWRAHRPAIHALVTDIRMPRMSGLELAGAIRAEDPHFPVVFASGFSDEGLGEGTAFDRFLDKPFTSTRLKEALDAVLASTAD